MSDRLPPVFDKLLEHLAEEGGKIVISRDTNERQDKQERWFVGYEFGHEEPDNPDNDMAGGAAYGMGPDLDTAVTQVSDQVGL